MRIHYDLELIDGVKNAAQQVLGLDPLPAGPHRFLEDASVTSGDDGGYIVALLRLARPPEHTVSVDRPVLGEFYD